MDLDHSVSSTARTTGRLVMAPEQTAQQVAAWRKYAGELREHGRKVNRWLWHRRRRSWEDEIDEWVRLGERSTWPRRRRPSSWARWRRKPPEPWRKLLDQVDRRLRRDEHYHRFVAELDRRESTGVDVQRMVLDAAAQRPLPDVMPAAALKYRLIDLENDSPRHSRRIP